MEKKPISFFLTLLNSAAARFVGTPFTFSQRVQSATTRLAALEAQKNGLQAEIDQLISTLTHDRSLAVDLYHTGSLALVSEDLYQTWLASVEAFRLALSRFSATPEAVAGPAPDEIVDAAKRLEATLQDLIDADDCCRSEVKKSDCKISIETLVHFVKETALEF